LLTDYRGDKGSEWVYAARSTAAVPPIRTVRSTRYSFDEGFGKDQPLSKSA
jgi:hypothetical protein